MHRRLSECPPSAAPRNRRGRFGATAWARRDHRTLFAGSSAGVPSRQPAQSADLQIVTIARALCSLHEHILFRNYMENKGADRTGCQTERDLQQRTIDAMHSLPTMHANV